MSSITFVDLFNGKFGLRRSSWVSFVVCCQFIKILSRGRVELKAMEYSSVSYRKLAKVKTTLNHESSWFHSWLINKDGWPYGVIEIHWLVYTFPWWQLKSARGCVPLMWPAAVCSGLATVSCGWVELWRNPPTLHSLNEWNQLEKSAFYSTFARQCVMTSVFQDSSLPLISPHSQTFKPTLASFAHTNTPSHSTR